MLMDYVGVTYPNVEISTEERLKKKKFEVFLPTRQVFKRHHRGALVQGITPLFPQYFFIQLDLDKPHWEAIYEDRGVLGLLGNERPFPVPDPDYVPWLREQVARGVYDDRVPQSKRFNKKALGERMRVLDLQGDPTNLTGRCVAIAKSYVKLVIGGHTFTLAHERVALQPVAGRV